MSQNQKSQYNKEYFDQSNSELLAIIDNEGRFEAVSKRWRETLGWTTEELKNKTYLELVHPDDLEKSVKAAAQQRADSGSVGYFENRFMHKDGGYVWLQWGGYHLGDNKLYAIARDITVLKEKEFFFEEMQKISKVGCWKFNLKTGDSLLSNEIFRILDEKEDSSFSIEKGIDYFQGEARNCIQEKMDNLIEKNEEYDLELPFISKIGNKKIVRIIGRSKKTAGAKEVYGLTQDVTEQVEKQKEFEKQRIKSINASKMASLGEMAANIAHEINNPLSLVLGRAEQLKEKVENDKISKEELLAGLIQIEKTSVRIASIIKSLKTFSKSDEISTFNKVPLRNIIGDTLELCAQKLANDGYNIVASKIPDIYINCKGAQLSQVFLNLINNSVEALANKKEKWIKFDFELKDKFVLIEIVDSGHGIEKSIQDKIMLPFFTTRENKGTGLGLSISRGIISDHKGKIYYDNSKQSTTFCIELPYEKK